MIHYHQAQWGKTRPGEKCLRMFMRKFVQVDSHKEAGFWGPAFCVNDARDHGPLEKRYRTLVVTGGMRQTEAQRIHDAIDDTVPFNCRMNVIKAMASLTALHCAEVNKTTQVQGVKLIPSCRERWPPTSLSGTSTTPG